MNNICGGVIDLIKCQKCGKWIKDESFKDIYGSLMAFREIHFDLCSKCKKKYKNVRLKKSYLVSSI